MTWDQWVSIVMDNDHDMVSHYIGIVCLVSGVATSGAFFYNHKDGNNNVAAQTEGETFDTCMGHADPMCRSLEI